ncbi:MAG: hypothetical protein FWE45_00445 [Firmicutes bacterium]|nr:hypothetical protein [Bacillota bacterium]
MKLFKFRKREKVREAKPRSKKRKIIALSAVVAVIGVFVLVVTLSTGTRSLYQVALDNLAEARFFMKQADSDNVRVQFFSGLREENYQMDGVAGRTIPFALLNIEPKNANHLNDVELRGTLQLGEDTPIDVTLERNQFGRNFATDIGRSVNANTTITFTLILENDYRVVFELKNSMPEDAIGWEDALKIAVEHLESDIKSAQRFETYVKIITDQANISAFWFVQFVTNTGELFFVVIGADGSVIGNQR